MIGLKKLRIMEEDLEKIAAKDIPRAAPCLGIEASSSDIRMCYATYAVPQGNTLARLLLSW